MEYFLIQIGLLFLTARLFGRLARAFALPALAGEILGGVFLGPSFLGRFFPHLFHSTGNLSPVFKTLMLIFIFFAGTEIHLNLVKSRLKETWGISLSGIAVPFLIGFILVLAAPGWWSHYSNISSLQLAFFLGTALSISALPVMARIFMDQGLLGTPMAGMVLAAATFDDIVGWLLLSGLIFSIHQSFSWMELLPFLVFWGGASCAAVFKKHEQWHKRLNFLVMTLIAPVYFASVGLRINLATSFDPVLTAVIFFIACAGKIAGVRLGGWLVKMQPVEARMAAWAMNARGAMEIVAATIALESRLIREPLFAALVFMAVMTSLLAAVALKKISHALDESTSEI